MPERGERMSRVGVFGAGSWGTTFAKVLADAGNDVTVWARREEGAAEINERHRNEDKLPGILPSAGLVAPADPGRAVEGAELVAFAVPSQTLRENLLEWAPILPPG